MNVRVIRSTLILAAVAALAARAGGGIGAASPAAPQSTAAEHAAAYVAGVRQVNEAHRKSPGRRQEPQLIKKMPRKARKGLERLLALEDADLDPGSLRECGEAALDLDLMENFEAIRKRLAGLSEEDSRALGTALSRDRYILRGLGGLDVAYLERFAVVLDAVLGAYDETFGFREFSKVPGKKLRFRIVLVEKIEKPPHFDPGPPFHSEVYFPVIDAEEFRSPTPMGQFLFYGLCHELGHVIAMWGQGGSPNEDHHSWAHYTGLVIVDHLFRTAKDQPFLKEIQDLKWRSLEKEKERLKSEQTTLDDADGVLRTLFVLHDLVGPKAFGDAINLLDRENRRLRRNGVRYYRFSELKDGFLRTLEDRVQRSIILRMLPD